MPRHSCHFRGSLEQRVISSGLVGKRGFLRM
jgi:hypothetical protein